MSGSHAHHNLGNALVAEHDSANSGRRKVSSMTTGASTSFETTVNITVIDEADGNNGPQWHLTVQFPWTNVEKKFVDHVYIDKSLIPDEPTRGIHRVEVAFKSLKNKQEGGKHSGTHYWMVNYYINKIFGPADQMNAQPNTSSIWPGKEDEAARNSGQAPDTTGNGYVPNGNPPANGNGGHYDPTAPYDLFADRRTYGIIKGHCENAVIAMMDKLPGLFNENGDPNWAMFLFYRDEFYNNFSAIDITVYAEDNEEPVAEAEAEEPAAPPVPPAPPAPAEHFCEKHQESYTRYTDGRYGHKWDEDKHWCLEGNDFLLDNNGNPVTEVLI